MTVYALSPTFWAWSQEADRRFRRVLFYVALPFAAAGLVIPFWQLAGLQRGGGAGGTARYAELLPEQPAPVAEQPEQPKPAEKEEVKTEQPKPAPKARELTPEQQQQAARAQASRAGVLALSDQLKDLRDATLPGLDASRPLTSGVIGGRGASGGAGSGVPTGIESAAAETSGGIGSGEVERTQSGTGLGTRRTATVNAPAGFGPDRTRIGAGGNRPVAGRTLEEIQLVFDRNKGAFYTLYNRVLRDNPSLQGKVTLNLTIAPSGAVTRCTIVASELHDPELERKIVARVLLLNFGAKNVEPITLDYPIYFIPS